MGTITDGVARSPAYRTGALTGIKQEHLGKIMGRTLGTAAAVVQQGWACPWMLYLDGSAGPGRDGDDDLSGCIAVLDTAAQRAWPLHAYLCEASLRRARSLEMMVRDSYRLFAQLRTTVVAGLFEQQADPLIATIRAALQHAGRRDDQLFGAVYFDPCGVYAGPIWSALGRLARAFPRVDILLHITATGHKRRLKQLQRLGTVETLPRLDECIRSLGKAHYHVRAPLDDWQWTFVLATNYGGWKPYSGIRMYPHDTPEAQRILERITYTVPEIKARQAAAQLGLPLVLDGEEDAGEDGLMYPPGYCQGCGVECEADDERLWGRWSCEQCKLRAEED